eukprot:jgi/Tetstr1/445007/TSEL_032815.t1
MVGGGGNRDNFKIARSARKAMAPRAAPAKDIAKDAGKGKAKADALALLLSELLRGSIENLYGTDDWGSKVLDLFD